MKKTLWVIELLLCWPLFKICYYFLTRPQLKEPLQLFDLAALSAGLFLVAIITLVYRKFLRLQVSVKRSQPSRDAIRKLKYVLCVPYLIVAISYIGKYFRDGGLSKNDVITLTCLSLFISVILALSYRRVIESLNKEDQG